MSNIIALRALKTAVIDAQEATVRMSNMFDNGRSPAWRVALKAVAPPALWFTLTAGTLWGLGCDPITSARYAFVPAAVFAALVWPLAGGFHVMQMVAAAQMNTMREKLAEILKRIDTEV